jgi:hypothetical protein
MVASPTASSETGSLSGQKVVAVVWLRIELAGGEAAAEVEAKAPCTAPAKGRGNFARD